MASKVDAETQTDPEITGVDADDFEEEESETESSEGEDEVEPATDNSQAKRVDKGTSSKPVRRKIIELKYYFGEDLPDAELTKRELLFIILLRSTWSICIKSTMKFLGFSLHFVLSFSYLMLFLIVCLQFLAKMSLCQTLKVILKA